MSTSAITSPRHQAIITALQSAGKPLSGREIFTRTKEFGYPHFEVENLIKGTDGNRIKNRNKRLKCIRKWSSIQSLA